MDDALYTSWSNISLANVIESRNKLVSEIEISLEKIKKIGVDLIQFNPTKTRVCVYTTKKLSLVVRPPLEGSYLYEGCYSLYYCSLPYLSQPVLEYLVWTYRVKSILLLISCNQPYFLNQNEEAKAHCEYPIHFFHFHLPILFST